MPRDEVLAGDTRAWLEQAAKDLRRVEILLAVTPPDVEGALFHSQQAAEKALKGFLTWHDITFRQVHELGEIGRQCLQADPTLSDLLQRANSLTKYAVRFRSWRAVRARS
jgi:HEPN domain-containing protein